MAKDKKTPEPRNAGPERPRTQQPGRCSEHGNPVNDCAHCDMLGVLPEDDDTYNF